MRQWLAVAMLIGGAASASAQARPTSAPVEITLTATKAGVLRLSPVAEADGTPSSTLQAAWNLPPAYAGRLLVQARRMGASAGATYIDSRVLPADLPAHADVVLADAASVAGTVHVVRLVVY